MSIYISGDIRCGANGYKTLILMQDGSVTDTDGDIIGKAIEVPPCGRLGDLDALALSMMDAKNADQALAMVDDAKTIIPSDEEASYDDRN